MVSAAKPTRVCGLVGKYNASSAAEVLGLDPTVKSLSAMSVVMPRPFFLPIPCADGSERRADRRVGDRAATACLVRHPSCRRSATPFGRWTTELAQDVAHGDINEGARFEAVGEMHADVALSGKSATRVPNCA
jgi:hypothetical protein